MFDNKWQKKEMPLVSLIGMGGGIASPAFLASIVLNILKPTVFSPVDDTGVPDFDYTAESSAITDISTVDALGDASAFSTTLYSGNGNGGINGQSINTGIDNASESLVWIKGRTGTSAPYVDHCLFDTLRGPEKIIRANDSGSTLLDINSLLSFDADGYATGGSGVTNVSGTNYVAWNFSSQPGFFDIQTWTGDGVEGRQIPHNLGSTPGMIMIKRTGGGGSENWVVYHKEMGIGQNLTLNENYASNSFAYVTAVSDTAFNVSMQFQTNGNDSSATYVAYLFADNPSNQIKCGSYTGNGTSGASSNATHLDFDPEWLLVKNIDSNGSNWSIVDSTRGNLYQLNANTTEAESNTGSNGLALFTGHFQAYGSSVDHNKSGDKYIYVAIGSPKVTVSNTQLTLTDTTVSRVSDGSLIGGTTIDEVLTVGETVQADTTISSTVTDTVFSTTSYSYTGNPRTITNGIDLAGEGGLIWTKWISGGAYSSESHCLIDTERSSGSASDPYGTFTPYLKSDATNAETNANYFNFNSDGYEIATSSSLVNHTSGGEYVSWTFRKAPGFFDIQTWTGDGTSGRQIAHDLGSEPGMIIVKCLSDAQEWVVWHRSAGQYEGRLNETSSFGWEYITGASSTDFTITYAGTATNQSGRTYVAYVFADNPGSQITCGSYVGAGYGGKLVTLGYKPHWLLIKKATGSGDWAIVDSTRGNFNELYANSGNTESTGSSQILVDFNPNGFYIDSDFNNGGVWDNNGETYIYMAIGNGEVDITTQSTASGTVSASSGNTITLSDVSGTWSTGMKVQGVDSDTKDNPDPIKVEDVSLTSSAPTAERNVSTWGDAVWEIATDENFTQNVQTAITALSATGTQAGPSFTLERNTGYYTRTKYTALGQESEWSDVTYFVTEALLNTFTDSYIESISATFDSNSNKVVVAYTDGGNSNYGTVVVGEVSGTDVIFGTPTVFNSATTYYISATFDSNSNKVVISYQDRANNWYGTSIVGTVSGTDISFGTPTVFNSGATSWLGSTFDTNSNKVVVAYRDNDNGGYGTAVVGTVSGTSISFGSESVYNSGNTYYSTPVFDSSQSKVFICYTESSSTDGHAIVGTVSGTSISFGSETTFKTTDINHLTAAYDSSQSKVVVAYRDSGNLGYGKAKVANVSGTSISFGSETTFESASVVGCSATYDSSRNKVVIGYTNYGNSGYGTAVEGIVSGTSISFATPNVLQNTSATGSNIQISAIYDSSNNKVVMCDKKGRASVI